MAKRKTIYLCLAHMSEEGWEQKCSVISYLMGNDGSF